MSQVAEKVVLYRFRSSSPLLKVQRVMQAINRLGGFGIDVQHEDGVVVFYVDKGISEIDATHLENVVSNLIRLKMDEDQ